MTTRTRRAGDVQTDEQTAERRTDLLNGLNVRVAVLEAAHKEIVEAKQSQSKAIEELDDALHDTASALREGLSQFSLKFDALIIQIKLGFYIISVGCSLVIFLGGLFIAYDKTLDEKYLQHANTFKQQTELVGKKAEALTQKANALEGQTEEIEDINKEIARLKKLKAIRASK